VEAYRIGNLLANSFHDGVWAGYRATRPGSRATRSALLDVEPMTGIEPAYSAWEADVLPLNYIGAVA
jgi:hypothetical protein